jgi:hypothetical protein
MTSEEHILLLAENYFDMFPDDFTGTKEQLISFAKRIRSDTLYEIISVLSDAPNPEVNRSAIYRIESLL